MAGPFNKPSPDLANNVVPQGEFLQKLFFTDKFLLEVEQLFRHDTGTIKRSAQEATAAMKKLQNDINRERAEMVVKLVQNGKLQQAMQKLKENYEPLRANDLEEILRQSIGGFGPNFLKNTILFVDHLDVELKDAAYVTIYEEMSIAGRTTDAEILLLQKKVAGLEQSETRLKVLNVKISIASDTLVDKFLEEVRSNQVVLIKKTTTTCSTEINNALLRLIVKTFFEKAPYEATLLVQYSQRLPFLKDSCCLIGEVFKQLKERNLLESEAALHLWAHAKYMMMHHKNFQNVSMVDRMPAIEAFNELSKQESSYLQQLKTHVDNNVLPAFISQTWSIISVMSTFIEWYYAGDKANAKMLIQVVTETGWITINGCILKSIYLEMQKFNHLATFEAFQLYHAVQKQTKMSNYSSVAKISKVNVEFVKERVPKCLAELLWPVKQRCRIVNKYYGEALFFLSGGGDNTVYTWVPRTNKEDQMWSYEINKNTSQVWFTHSSKANHLGCKTQGGVSTPCSGKSGKFWMIKTIDAYYIKIFTLTDGSEEYLTANPGLCTSNSSKRRIQLTKENATDRQLWQLEFSL